MSASLVGSEMCIRDRLGTGRGGMGTTKLDRTMATEAPAVGQAARMRATVSYTHLTLPTICSV
eukprot:6564017-Alexandrium_andersonii.AAC.1